MHGFGNDFVVLDGETEVDGDLVRSLCDRRFGVGADGVLHVGFEGAVTMGYWNADGSIAEMCGNGLRCVARRAVDLGLVDAQEFEVVTPAGVKRVRVSPEMVSVDLGPIELGDGVEIDGRGYRLVDVGNPHAVSRVDPDSVDVQRIGPRIERDPMFPNGTNVEFYVPWRNASSVRMRVWERGVGETHACGTGMVAVAAAARIEGDVQAATVSVTVPGGTGTVTFDDGVWLTGPTETVFAGEWLSGAS
jgi:diaminopimelate epimerase